MLMLTLSRREVHRRCRNASGRLDFRPTRLQRAHGDFRGGSVLLSYSSHTDYVCLEREIHVRTQIVNPKLFRAAVKEQNVGFDALGIENTGRQAQQDVQVAVGWVPLALPRIERYRV